MYGRSKYIFGSRLIFDTALRQRNVKRYFLKDPNRCNKLGFVSKDTKALVYAWTGISSGLAKGLVSRLPRKSRVAAFSPHLYFEEKSSAVRLPIFYASYESYCGMRDKYFIPNVDFFGKKYKIPKIF